MGKSVTGVSWLIPFTRQIRFLDGQGHVVALAFLFPFPIPFLFLARLLLRHRNFSGPFPCHVPFQFFFPPQWWFSSGRGAASRPRFPLLFSKVLPVYGYYPYLWLFCPSFFHPAVIVLTVIDSWGGEAAQASVLNDLLPVSLLNECTLQPHTT